MATPADREGRDAAQAPRPSATVVLARAAAPAPELFLVHRVSGSAFGASYVFPGGVLEGDDCEAPVFSDDLPAEAANLTLGLPAGGLDYYCAAIRELFEESGVLLARSRKSRDAAPPLPRATLEQSRTRLNAGRLRWPDFLRAYDLVLCCGALHYFAWWITPRDRPKRFSTRFFLAALPEGQEASHDGGELTDSRWMSAADAIAAFRAGELVLPPPTFATLTDLAELEDLPGLLRWAGQRTEAGVPRILPAIVSREGRETILLPGDPGYPPDADRGET